MRPVALAIAAGVAAYLLVPKGPPKLSLERQVQLPPFSGAAVETGKARPWTSAELAGRPWVVAFIFTRCTGPCPMVSARMSELQKVLPAQVGLLSVTVDPDYDTPERLGRYAELFQARPGRWTYLRMERAALLKVVQEGFRLPLALPAGGSQAIHSQRLMLVDAQGWVRGSADAADARAVEELGRGARVVLGEKR